MKLQGLAVIFVLIILPISIVLSEYIQVQIDTLRTQTVYDTQLLNATYDCVVAFQKNTINSWSSDLAQSKIRDCEAAANVFLTAIADNFKMSGNSKDAIKEYVPAIVFTLYDGYYIYSPFYNQIGSIDLIDTSKYQNNTRLFGLKPYIYYSKEYTYNGCSFTITYSLDNYITIQGEVKENGTKKVVSESGYIIDINPSQISSDGTMYKGVPINNKENDRVYEYVDDNSNINNRYECTTVNGGKYYRDNDNNTFVYRVKEKHYSTNQNLDFNKNNAQEYYKNAYEFTNKVLNKYGLKGLKSSNNVGWDNTQQEYVIFNDNGTNIEYYNSGFNQERRAVIKDSIESNLLAAIANYNNISDASNDINFQMPKLAEDEWDKIINNISVITFLQGINMGNRPYNGYAIVTNNKNEETVSEDSIYITTTDGQYHRVNDKDLLNYSEGELKQGIYNMNFERRSVNVFDNDGSTIDTNYFYPNIETGCYNSIVNQSNVDSLLKSDGTPKSIYEYLNDISSTSAGKKIATLYYTALGRERYGMRRVNNPFTN